MLLAVSYHHDRIALCAGKILVSRSALGRERQSERVIFHF